MVQVNEPMQTWERKGYSVVKESNEILGVYDDDGVFICHIMASDDEIQALNNGEDIDDWEDGVGNPVPLMWDEEKGKFVDSRN